MGSSPPQEQVAVIAMGCTRDRNLWLGFSLGFDINTSELLLSTASGAPEESYYVNVDLDEPERSRRLFVDIKQVMQESDRGFYVDQVETTIKDFWEKHAEPVCDTIKDPDERNPENSLREYFLENFRPPILDELELRLVSLDDIKFEDSTEFSSPRKKTESSPDEESSRDNLSEETNASEESSETVVPIELKMDVNRGKRVSNLQPGDRVSVRLMGRTAEKVRDRIGMSPTENLPPLSARVLSVDSESESDSLTVITELKQGFYGVAKVRPNSKIEVEEDILGEGTFDYEEQLSSFVWLIVNLLAITAIFVIFITFI